jgi:hypothetical protein
LCHTLAMLVAIVYGVYGLLLYVEAGTTYRKDRVRQALISGLVTGTVLIAAAVMVLLQVRMGASVGLGVRRWWGFTSLHQNESLSLPASCSPRRFCPGFCSRTAVASSSG